LLGLAHRFLLGWLDVAAIGMPICAFAQARSGTVIADTPLTPLRGELRHATL